MFWCVGRTDDVYEYVYMVRCSIIKQVAYSTRGVDVAQCMYLCMHDVNVCYDGNGVYICTRTLYYTPVYNMIHTYILLYINIDNRYEAPPDNLITTRIL